ncbi:glycosyltransferase family 39 protein [Flavobacteriaceae sp. LMIT009]
MIRRLEQHPILSICIIVLLMCCVSFSVLDVTIMEARNFITAREMVNDGNWLLTTMNGEPRYQKPPLPTWLTAISALVFGLKNVLVLRFPAIIMIAITGIFSYLLSLKLLENKRHAFINGLITITSFYVIGIVVEAPWDIFTHGFMLVAIYHLFQLFEKKEKYWNHTIIAGIFFGLSLLCKGPISLYALLLPFLIAYGSIYKYNDFKQKAFSLFSFILIAIVIGGWWFLYVRLEDPETFAAITSKETGNWGSYNVRPFYYYWSFFTQSGLWTIPAFIALLYPYMKSRVSNLKVYQLTFWWTIIAVILLSIIPEKKSRYLMPVLIPMAINTGFYIKYLIGRFGDLKDKREIFPVYFNFGLIALLGILFPLVGFFFGPFLAGPILVLYLVSSLTLVIIGIKIIVNLRRKEINKVFYSCILFLVTIMLLLTPFSNIQSQADYRSIGSFEGDIELYSLGYVSPEMIWQYGDKLPQIKPNDSMYNFPDVSKFGILVQELNDTEKTYLEMLYNLEHQETFDLNKKASEEKGYRKRLVSHYYILTKK